MTTMKNTPQKAYIAIASAGAGRKNVKMTITSIGMRISPALKRASTKSRTYRFCTPLSRAGR